MSLSTQMIRRPVTATLIAVALVVFGLIGYVQLPINDLPTIDFPTLQVSASLPGASPETMATAVATPLEQQFTTVAGISTITSTSSQSSTQITLQFNLERDIDAAAQDVQTAIAQASRQLPPDLPSPPSLRKVNPAEQPVFYLALSSEVLPLAEVNRSAEVQIAQRLSMVDGVSQVQVFGAQKYAVRVRVDPQALSSKGIGIDEALNAVRTGNSNLPTGNLYGPKQTYSVEDNGRLDDAAGYRQLIISYKDGSPVRLSEVAEVSDSVANERSASWYNGTRSIVLAIQRQPGSNTVAITSKIRAMIPELKASIPAAINVDVLFDRSQSIKESITDVEHTLLLTIVLVIMVVYLFLGSLVTTILPSLAIVISLVATFGIIWLLGYSLNNISLMALTLSVGFVVDDAIVMVENIVRRQEEGERRWTAALLGSEEITTTVISTTVALVAVFIPILFMGGLLGRLFREFAVTLSVAVIFSSVVALTVTPMMAARFLPQTGVRSIGLFNNNCMLQWFNRSFERLTDLYAHTLTAALRRPRAIHLFSVILLFLTVFFFQLVPKGFIPNVDTGQLSVNTQAVEGISFQEMAVLQDQLAQKLFSNPNIDGVNSTIGSGGPNASANSGRLFLRLKPRSERPLGAEELTLKLRSTVNSVPGLKGFVRQPSAINIGGSQSRARFQFTLQAIDLSELMAIAPDFEQKLRTVSELTDVNSDLLLNNPKLKVNIDRDRAAALGLNVATLQSALRDAYGEGQISTIYKSDGQYAVISGVKLVNQNSPADLDLISIRSSSGKLVPLGAVASLERGSGIVTINHNAQLPSVTFSFNVRPGVSLDRATAQISELARETLPAGVSTSFQGDAKVFGESFANLGLLAFLAILVIYMVLGILYEDFIHPLTILTSLPSAAVGGLATLLLFGSELNIYSYIGLILLIGIVKKNGIMMIDFAVEASRTGLMPPQAIYQASLTRFRPIMMTTVSSVIGVLPIALGLGAGAEARRPLGLVVLGGLVVSQIVTLYITPVFYVTAEGFASRLGLRSGGPSAAANELPHDAFAVAGVSGNSALPNQVPTRHRDGDGSIPPA
ncbi:efflux RND transporter permease subunit [Synechococcus sp. Cruz-9H2]|uniref:efflux RND transporter permease subunit n=1 Tax=unclassified Synechococcus TaxID=2626047 RepID=UPI0020CF4527|nr:MULTISPECIES: efflux RND transporter permease subunit [unclassified Synechococcus]MCP9820182.1 efflux RND transporter permease subunit [Synechococcus sp. Cruz-9H2]MCP9844578.1 efflux RND transporter permease subunit [Synechococcus sp. Edmonson 11F2]MCP9856612.1 efflux RND transporter permease subunit [Synechococcus sp. Cruz-9C9]MCP9863897.1 efflux RND transporter permease subunit [Synechococcus sp. Cruz-7E5]MCP9871181.1 efflux RND transporter permease subunit [Synechococcus sp. Cruz-7B9]